MSFCKYGMDAGLQAVRVIKTLQKKSIVRKGEGKMPLDTGFGDIASSLASIKPGEIWTIAGRPGIGLEQTLNTLAIRLAANHARVQLAAVIQSPNQAIQSLLAGLSGVNYFKFAQFAGAYNCELKDNDISLLRQAQHWLDDHSINISGGLNSDVFEGLMGSPERRPDVVIVDDISLFNDAVTNKLEMDKALADLSAYAAKEKIAIIIGTNLSRKIEGRENRRPHLSDLYTEEAICQHSDKVILLYREDFYRERDIDNGEKGKACTHMLDLKIHDMAMGEDSKPDEAEAYYDFYAFRIWKKNVEKPFPYESHYWG